MSRGANIALRVHTHTQRSATRCSPLALTAPHAPSLPQEEANDVPEWLKEAEENDAMDEGDVGGVSSDALLAHARAASSASTAVVLLEDKKFYPDADEVYPEAETMVQDEDTQPLSQPIIAPVKTKLFSLLETTAPTTTYSADFLASLMGSPALIRNVAVVGHLHHGKTSLLDMLIERTHVESWRPDAQRRYTDARGDEQARGVSIKATPVSLVMQDAREKSYLVNLVDTPGHTNFSDDVTASLRLADGVLLVVDAVEGVMLNTERLVRHALLHRLPIVLVVAKVDRLIVELKLPTADAYFKLLHVIGEVNHLIRSNSHHGSGDGAEHPPLHPVAGNVVFSAAHHGWSFTLDSWAAMHLERQRRVAIEKGGLAGSARPAGEPKRAVGESGGAVAPSALAKRLWGDVWYDPRSRTFNDKSPGQGAARTFITFVLEPLYKVYSSVLGEEPATLAQRVKALGVYLTPAELHADPRPLLKTVLSRWVGDQQGLVSAVVAHIPSPAAAAGARVPLIYTGSPASPEAVAMRECNGRGPLMVNVAKLIPAPDGASFLALARVWSGCLAVGDRVRVLGESYGADDEEDSAVATVSALGVGQARYRLDVTLAPPGNWVLIEGVCDVISKTATLTSASPGSPPVSIFRPLTFNTIACVNVSVEPLNPSELPKVLAGLRAVTKSYPLARTRVEESGEHVLIGTGELALDSMLHDLREMFARVEVKVADPVVSFQETVGAQSSVPCFGLTPNKKNKLSMLAEPLDRGACLARPRVPHPPARPAHVRAPPAGLADELDAGVIDSSWDGRTVAAHLSANYGWDALAARGLWAFGPTSRGPNVLVDDTLPGQVDKKALSTCRDSIVQGFVWGSREGPLCDEPMRGVKFRLLDAGLSSEPIARGGGQVIPTARRVGYSAFLLAEPRLLEPVYHVEVLCPGDAVPAVAAVLSRRRGHVTAEVPKPGTPFTLVRGLLPVMDSFGFETDLSVHTQGVAFGMQVFDNWSLVPGDPLDTTIVLRPLEPSPPAALAREFMVKTRRRKGLAEEVSATKYFDDAMLEYLAAQDGGMQQ